MREREREREKERERERETDRQTDRDTEREREREIFLFPHSVRTLRHQERSRFFLILEPK